MRTWKKMNKTKAIKLHLEKYGRITTWEAIKEYGATRLSSIIYNLRHNYNMNIISKDIYFTDRYGTESNYVMYVLKQEQENE